MRVSVRLVRSMFCKARSTSGCPRAIISCNSRILFTSRVIGVWYSVDVEVLVSCIFEYFIPYPPYVFVTDFFNVLTAVTSSKKFCDQIRDVLYRFESNG